jgi:hypothetical protein
MTAGGGNEMSHRSGLLHTFAAIVAAIVAAAVIVAVLTGHGHRQAAAWSPGPHCKPGTHMAYIAKQMVCLRPWHLPWD